MTPAQVTQVAPLSPQNPASGGATHSVPRRQQPLAQLAEVHLHCPPTHCWPAPHEAPVPHPHWPVGKQALLTNASHAMHVAPGAPQAAADVGVHVLPAQHPASQLATSQMHCPPEHRCPAAHGAPVVPHTQAPDGLHRSVFCASQAAHATPPSPHVGNDGVTH